MHLTSNTVSKYFTMPQFWFSHVFRNKNSLRDLDDNKGEYACIEPMPLTCYKCHVYRKPVYWWTLINTILSTISIAIILKWAKETYSQNPVLKHSSFYCISPLTPHIPYQLTHQQIAPVLNHLTLPTATKQIQGTLFPPSNPSIGRAFPNPQSDDIWDEIELTRTIVITADDVRRLGKDLETVVRFEDDVWGLGGDAFMGQIGE